MALESFWFLLCIVITFVLEVISKALHCIRFLIYVNLVWLILCIILFSS